MNLVPSAKFLRFSTTPNLKTTQNLGPRTEDLLCSDSLPLVWQSIFTEMVTASLADGYAWVDGGYQMAMEVPIGIIKCTGTVWRSIQIG